MGQMNTQGLSPVPQGGVRPPASMGAGVQQLLSQFPPNTGQFAPGQPGMPPAVANPMQTSQFAPTQSQQQAVANPTQTSQPAPGPSNTTIPQGLPGTGGLAAQLMNPQLLSLLTNPNMRQILSMMGASPGQMGNFVGNMGPCQIPGLFNG